MPSFHTSIEIEPHVAVAAAAAVDVAANWAAALQSAVKWKCQNIKSEKGKVNLGPVLVFSSSSSSPSPSPSPSPSSRAHYCVFLQRCQPFKRSPLLLLLLFVGVCCCCWCCLYSCVCAVARSVDSLVSLVRHAISQSSTLSVCLSVPPVRPSPWCVCWSTTALCSPLSGPKTQQQQIQQQLTKKRSKNKTQNAYSP